MALGWYRIKIPVDEVIDMYQVGSILPTAFRETAEGGLAATPTGRRLPKRNLSANNFKLLGESMSSLSAIFFDLDGTLCGQLYRYPQWLHLYFEQLGVPSPDAQNHP